MIDYKLLEALATVIEEEGFEKAAGKLFITQSAVSQRIRLLEDQQGQILITRQNPPLPTGFGKKLIKHFNQIRLLETELINEGENKKENDFLTINLGINADSLATWFLPALKSFLRDNKILLNLKVDDQDETKRMLQNGEVAGCISSSKTPVQGCSVNPLGKMDYVLVSTQSFFETHFKKGFIAESLSDVPAVVFNKKDKLHEQFLKLDFGRTDIPFPNHHIPSAEQYLSVIEKDLAYGVITTHQFDEYKDKYSLTLLSMNRLSVDLYWHHWNIRSSVLEGLSDTVLKNGKKYLH